KLEATEVDTIAIAAEETLKLKIISAQEKKIEIDEKIDELLKVYKTVELTELEKKDLQKKVEKVGSELDEDTNRLLSYDSKTIKKIIEEAYSNSDFKKTIDQLRNDFINNYANTQYEI